MDNKNTSFSKNTQSILMTPVEVADYLRISISTVYTKKSRGEFPEGTTVKLFGKLLFKRTKIEQLVEDSIEPSFGRFWSR